MLDPSFLIEGVAAGVTVHLGDLSALSGEYDLNSSCNKPNGFQLNVYFLFDSIYTLLYSRYQLVGIPFFLLCDHCNATCQLLTTQ